MKEKLACLAIVLAACSSRAVGTGTPDTTSGGSGAGSGGSATASASSSLFGVAVGASRTFTAGDCTTLVTCEGTDVVDGRDVFVQTNDKTCPSGTLSATYYAHVEGDRVETRSASGDTSWYVVSDAPVAAGHTWTTGPLTYEWASAGTVTVPAGTFSDCWTAKASSTTYEAELTYCRGIGLVRTRILAPASAAELSELTDFSPK